MSEPQGKAWIIVTWDRQTDHEGKPVVFPTIMHYEDDDEAAEIYQTATRIRDATYLYRTDESGHMDLILEHERLPTHRG